MAHDDDLQQYYPAEATRPLTIRQKIKVAKKVFVYLNPDYRRNDSPIKTVTIPVSVAQALKIVDMSPKSNPPTGVIDKHGHLLLEPPAAPTD